MSGWCEDLLNLFLWPQVMFGVIWDFHAQILAHIHICSALRVHEGAAQEIVRKKKCKPEKVFRRE